MLAERCNIGPNSHVLDVGCGTGGNSAYLASKYGCRITGIDISDMMVEKARERAIEKEMEDLLDFRVDDAYNLDFPENNFDTVLTVFVSQFLDLDKAFPEFSRVLKSSGFLGINEMYRADYVPPEAIEKVDLSEQIFRELTRLPFSLRTPTEWETGFKNSKYTDVSVEHYTSYIDVKSGLDMIDELGGWMNLTSLLWETLSLGLKSKKIRQKYAEINKGKSVLLSDKIVSKYIGYVLGVGKKGVSITD